MFAFLIDSRVYYIFLVIPLMAKGTVYKAKRTSAARRAGLLRTIDNSGARLAFRMKDRPTERPRAPCLYPRLEGQIGSEASISAFYIDIE